MNDDVAPVSTNTVGLNFASWTWRVVGINMCALCFEDKETEAIDCMFS